MSPNYTVMMLLYIYSQEVVVSVQPPQEFDVSDEVLHLQCEIHCMYTITILHIASGFMVYIVINSKHTFMFQHNATFPGAFVA